MQLKISSESIQEALRVVGRLAPPTTGSITIESDSKKVWMHSESTASRCSVLMPAEVSGKARTFAISYEALRDATKGRKELDVSYDKTMLKVKSGSYNAELATTDALKIEHDEEEKGKSIKLTQDQASWLKTAVSHVALKPSALLAGFMPVSVKLSDKGAFVACYDTNHMAFLRSKEIKGDLEFTLPIETITSILDVFSSASFSLEIGRSNIVVKNKLVNVVLAQPEVAGEALTLKDVLQTAKSTTTQDGKLVEVEKKGVSEFLDNAKAVMTKERGELSVEAKGGKMKLEIVTVNGSSRTILKANSEAAIKARFDYEYIEEAVRKCGDTLTMKIVDDAYVAFNRKVSESDLSVVVSVNQE